MIRIIKSIITIFKYSHILNSVVDRIEVLEQRVHELESKDGQ